MDGAEAASSPKEFDRTTRLLAALLAVLVCGQIVLLWLPRYLPTNDGPAHLYSAWVARQLADDPHDPLSKWFYPNPHAIYPNAGYSEFLQVCARFLPIQRAERIALSLYFVALPLAVGFFARSLGRDPILPALFAAGISFSWLFFLGFFNFLWGVPAVFAFLGLEQRVLERPTVRGLVATNILLALTFWFHLVAFGAALLAAAMLALLARRIWTAAASVLPVVLLSPLFWPRTVGVSAHWRWSHRLSEQFGDVIVMNIATAFGGVERQVAVGMGFVIVVAALLGLRRESRGRVAVIALVGMFFAGAVIAPEAIGSGAALPERLALFAWLFLGLALDLGRGRARVALAAFLAAAMGLHALFIAGQFRQFDRAMAVYMSGKEMIPKGARVFTLTRVPKAHRFVIRPMATAHNYYYISLGSPNFTHYEAARENAPQFPVGYTKEALKYFLGEKRPEDKRILKVTDWADYVVLWNPIPRQLSRLTTRGGYRVLSKRGNLTVLVSTRVPATRVG